MGNQCSNRSGSSKSSEGIVTASIFTNLRVQAAVLLWSVLQARQNFFGNYGDLAIAVDFLLNVVAILLATTIYSGAPINLCASLITPALLLYLISPPNRKARRSTPLKRTPDGSSTSPSDSLESHPFPVRPFITAYRGTMLVITCVAILAVDFPVFPRRFVKVENWGTSLMDVGVGSFVFTAGVVGAKATLRNAQPTRLSSRLSKSSRHSLPLFILGFVRLYSVKGLDYAEHVTEYGVHWNFFFTLALLPPFMALLQSILSYAPYYGAWSFVIVVAYEIALDYTELKGYILTAPRVTLLSQNREGVFSFFGYLAIFLAGQALGRDVLPRGSFTLPTGPASPKRIRYSLLLRLAAHVAVWTILFSWSTAYQRGLGLQVSRRLANLPYVLWISAFNSVQITIFCVIETVVFPGVYGATSFTAEKGESAWATSRVLHAFNRNGLSLFLLANLLTGLVNLTLDTIGQSSAIAMFVLLIHAATVTFVALILDSWNLTIKL